jgi:hypothetical protein
VKVRAAIVGTSPPGTAAEGADGTVGAGEGGR